MPNPFTSGATSIASVLGKLTDGSGGGLTNSASFAGGLSFKPSVGGMIGSAADFAGSLIKEKNEYDGEYGAITSGMDTAYDRIADTMMNIPGWGTVVGAAMKGAAVLGKGLGRLGGGTDGKTRKDAVLGSSFFNWNVGLINGFGGKKSMSIDKDYNTWALAGNSYTGSENTFNLSLSKIGKYGLWSSRERKMANDAISTEGRRQNLLNTIMDDNLMRLMSLAQQQDMNNQEYMNLMNGGYNLSAIHSARKGGILLDFKAFLKAHRVASRYIQNQPTIPNFDNVEIVIEEPQNDIDKFQNGGLMNLIPEGALHARKHQIEDVNPELEGEITKKGIPVVSIETGELVAEIERNEIILNAELTDDIEKLRDEYHKAETQKDKDEIARKAGELLTIDLIENTDDKTGLFKEIEV